MGNAYINGEWKPLGEVRISPLDRGFLFGDGVYEVIPVNARRPFFLDRHLERMGKSLEWIGMDNPMGREEWTRQIGRLVRECEHDDQLVYVQCTRGVAPRAHPFPENPSPTVFMMANPFVRPPHPPTERGVRLLTAPDRRWLNCHIKSVSLLAAVLGAQEAREGGCDEIVFIRDGTVTECSSSNVLLVKDGTVLSPVADHRILPGITYRVVLEIAARLGIPVEERDLAESELRSADEVWIASSARDLRYADTLDGKPVGSGQPGGLFSKIAAELDRLKTAQPAIG